MARSFRRRDEERDLQGAQGLAKKRRRRRTRALRKQLVRILRSRSGASRGQTVYSKMPEALR